MKDEVDKKIGHEGNTWIYAIIICVIAITLLNKCQPIVDVPEPTNIENPK